MRTRVVWLMAALMIGLAASAPGQGQQVTNLLTNGGFESGQIGPYGTYGTCTTEVVQQCVGAAVPEGPVEGKNCLHVTVPAAGANNWDVGMTDASFTFKQGKKYTFACFIKVKSGTLQIRMKPERGADPWEAFNELVLTATDKWQEFYTTTAVMTADVTPASPTFHFAFAAGDFWIDGIRFFEGDYVKPTFLKSFVADDPSPEADAVDVPRDVTLSWTAGPYAGTHNVYFGATFDDVNSATVASAALVSPGQAGTTFQPAALLEYGKTYFWRVDEVNAAPSTAVFKGSVWSFTVEQYVYPITAVTATASSFDKATNTPANTVNGSGLTGDLHGTSIDTTWTSAMGAAPVWIQYQFDKAYKLSELWVWNHNTEFESVLGYGLKDVTIEYSLDGTTWTLLKDMQFAQAQASGGYAHNTTVDFAGVMAQYVKITAKSNYSLVGLKQYGLSEVRFFYIPVQARLPQPATADSGIGIDSTLDWRPGRDAASQNVYFGTSKAAVADGTAAVQTVTTHGFDPGALNFGTTYYWKVDGIGAVTYPGSVWSFTTQEYATVDDFEGYDDKDNRIFDVWADGQVNSTGSLVGYWQAPFAEQTIVHGGGQSMPFEYNNVKAPFYSEAERTFDSTLDLTANGANSLTLYFQGYPVAFAETASSITLSGSGADIYMGTAQFRMAYKRLTGDGSITVRLDSAQTAAAWTKCGVMIRESLDPLAMQVHMVSAPQQTLVEWMYRSAANSATTTQFNTAASTNPLPVWLRLTRAGNVFTGESSADGKTWTKIAGTGTTTSTTTIAMSSTVYIGMVVCSQAAGKTASADFSQVNITGNVAGAAWQTAKVGNDNQPANTPAPLYLTVEDKAGKKKTVVNPDAAAVTKGAWTPWQIALSDLTGVNLAAVKKLTIGVGDKASPKAGATGMLFIDDILFGTPIVADKTNVVVNGGFETGVLAPWGAWGGGGQTVTTAVVTDCAGAAVAEGPVEGKYCLNVKVSGASTNFWDCAFNQGAPAYAKGKKYTLSAFFKVKSGTGKINMKPEHGAANWEGYGEQQVTITDKWVEYHVTTPVFAADVSPASLTFHIGFQGQEFWVDNVKFYEGDYVASK